MRRDRAIPWAACTGGVLCAWLLLGAAPFRHLSWFGLVLGRDGRPMRAEVEMEGGSADASTDIHMTLMQDSVGAVRGWQVRRGTCERPLGPFGDPAAYPPLRVSGAGKTLGEATVALAVPDSGDFHAVVTESPAASGRIIGCGALLVDD
jgi:hypothetical protein